MYEKILNEALPLWSAGGWAMIPLAFNALLLCGKAIELRLSLIGKGYMKKKWGLAGKLKGAPKQGVKETERAALVAVEYLSKFQIDLDNLDTDDQIVSAFDEIRARELPPIDRDLKFIRVAMAAAPLWGLLGTVSGMLSTFDGLARGGGGDKTMDMVASGISEALITTQTGLMVALPGYFFHYYLSRHRQRYESFLAHLQTAYIQHAFYDGHLDQLSADSNHTTSPAHEEVAV